MTSYSAVPEPKDRIPQSEFIGILKSLDSVLKNWANLPSRFIGTPAEGPAALPLEFSVRFSKPAFVFLNVRTTVETAQILVRSLRCQAIDSIPEEEIFKEFVKLFGDRLMVFLWGKNSSPFQPEEPILSGPQNWPADEPTASCAFIVENFPIEVRLWTENKRRN